MRARRRQNFGRRASEPDGLVEFDAKLEMPTEEELAWLDMQCDALDRAAAEDAWVAQQTRTYPELHADEARWLFNACPPSPILQRACPPEVPEPCSMDEY